MSIKRFVPKRTCRILLCCAFVVVSLSACDEELLQRLLYAQRYQNLEINDADNTFANPAPDKYDTETFEAFYSDVSIPRCEELLVGPPRGLACLHCMHLNARAQAKILVVLLLKSCLQNIAINYLVDGTFSFDEELLKEHIRLLSSNGRRLFVSFYLTNGPSQRQWQSTPIKAFATTVSPEEFRTNILSDPGVQKQYQSLLYRLMPVIRFASERGVIVSLIPALEDNLTNDAFDELYRLTVDALPGDLSAAIGRNPCPGCYDDNGSRVPAGVFLEEHTASPFLQTRDGLVTNDGRDYRIETEPFNKSTLSLDDLKAVMEAAGRHNSTFILWSGIRQGLRDGLILPADERDFAIPDIVERKKLIEFLRSGL